MEAENTRCTVGTNAHLAAEYYKNKINWVVVRTAVEAIRLYEV